MYPISWVAWWRRPRTWSTTSSTLPPFSTLTAIEIEIGRLCVMFFQTCSTTNVLLPTYLPCLLLAYGVGGWSLMRLVEERGKLVNSKKRELWLRKEWESWREREGCWRCWGNLWCQPRQIGYLEVCYDLLEGAGGKGWDGIKYGHFWVKLNRCYALFRIFRN